MALQASLEAKAKALRRAEQGAVQKAEQVQHDLAVARRDCERSAGDAEDRKVQLSVLVETVETLQAGTPGTASTCALYMYIVYTQLHILHGSICVYAQCVLIWFLNTPHNENMILCRLVLHFNIFDAASLTQFTNSLLLS